MKSSDPDMSNHPTAQLICDIQFNSRCCTWLAGWLAKYVDQSMGAWRPPQPDITHFHLNGLRFIFQPSGPTCSSNYHSNHAQLDLIQTQSEVADQF